MGPGTAFPRVPRTLTTGSHTLVLFAADFKAQHQTVPLQSAPHVTSRSRRSDADANDDALITSRRSVSSNLTPAALAIIRPAPDCLLAGRRRLATVSAASRLAHAAAASSTGGFAAAATATSEDYGLSAKCG